MSSETKSEELLRNMLETRQGLRTDDVFNIFDSLEPVDQKFMHGLWKGSEIATGHPMDGLREATNWFGKWFKNNEEAHPLVHTGPFGKLFSATLERGYSLRSQSSHLVRLFGSGPPRAVRPDCVWWNTEGR